MWRKYLPHMQARQTDNEETTTLSFVGSFVHSLYLITGLWHHPGDGRQAVNHLVAMIWDEGDRDLKDKTVCPISRVRSLWQQKPMSESEAAFPDESQGKHPSHTICHTHRTHLLSFAPTVGKYLRNVLSLLLVCERLVCFAFFELEWAN